MEQGQKSTYQVTLTDINLPNRSFSVPLRQSIIVGRDKGLCDITLDYDKSISAKHCDIVVRGNKFYIKDLQSTNGTYVNSSKVLKESKISPGDILRLGRLEMRFEARTVNPWASNLN